MSEIDEITKAVTCRRLSLCKQLFLHGYNSSYKTDGLSKMMAVHNFHNSLELFLRSLFLHYNIRQEKTINIEFEVMLSEIDSWCSKNKKSTLPYRQELRNLNQQRNHVQHHAIEPETSTMDYWRVYTRLFFEVAFKQFYDIDFESFNSISLINDHIIGAILEKSSALKNESKFEESIFHAKLSFQVAALSFQENMPSEGLHSAFFLSSKFRGMSDVTSLIEKLTERIKMSEQFTLILTSGINSSDYTKYIYETPNIQFSINGYPHFNSRSGITYTAENCSWILETTINWILMWQRNGINVKVPDYMIDNIKKISEEGIDFS